MALSTRQRLRDTVQRGDDDGRTSADRPQHGAHGCAVGVHARVVATCRAIRASCLGIATGLGLQSSGHRFEPSVPLLTSRLRRDHGRGELVDLVVGKAHRAAPRTVQS